MNQLGRSLNWPGAHSASGRSLSASVLTDSPHLRVAVQRLSIVAQTFALENQLSVRFEHRAQLFKRFDRILQMIEHAQIANEIEAAGENLRQLINRTADILHA